MTETREPLADRARSMANSLESAADFVVHPSLRAIYASLLRRVAAEAERIADLVAALRNEDPKESRKARQAAAELSSRHALGPASDPVAQLERIAAAHGYQRAWESVDRPGEWYADVQIAKLDELAAPPHGGRRGEWDELDRAVMWGIAAGELKGPGAAPIGEVLRVFGLWDAAGRPEPRGDT